MLAYTALCRKVETDQKNSTSRKETHFAPFGHQNFLQQKPPKGSLTVQQPAYDSPTQVASVLRTFLSNIKTPLGGGL